MKRFIILLNTLLLLSLTAIGQTNGSNSSYSRFGLGTLNDQSQGFNRGMGGVGVGIRLGQELNMSNPASYSALDSLSLLFDIGMNVSLGHLSSKNTSINVRNCNIDFVNAGFRLHRGLGISLGFVPYTTIGYNFTTESNVARQYSTSQTITSTNTYQGEGGLHEVYLGLGWKVIKDLSIGANFGYLWGAYDHSLRQTFSENGTTSSNYSGLNSLQMADIRTYKLDFGVQYPILLSKMDMLTLGATAGIGHQIKSDSKLIRYTTAGDSTEITAKHPFDMPYSFGIGASLIHKGKLLVAADAIHERWGECRAPMMSTAGGVRYQAEKGSYMNRTKVAVGAQYLPDVFGKTYLKRMTYRAGANFSTPYMKVNGKDGPSEFGLTAGVGLPIVNKWNKRSSVNVNLQWFRRASSEAGMIKENFFMINVGMSFNERWFMKYKIQ